MIDNCTGYDENIDPQDGHPCQCPVCGGWLAWDENGEPVCNKCGAELVKVPEVDEDTKETMECGKICAISGRKKTIEQSAEERRINRLVKEGAKKWKGWL
jgi:hypothetical protein